MSGDKKIAVCATIGLGLCCVVLLVAIGGAIGAVFASWRGALELAGLALAGVAAITLLRPRRAQRGRRSRAGEPGSQARLEFASRRQKELE